MNHALSMFALSYMAGQVIALISLPRVDRKGLDSFLSVYDQPWKGPEKYNAIITG